ncbi:cyclic nucleotide-binding domain protein [delta proteobacterium NaphS2]|nr:cyclic nucleotide-binding domain protein [delta proteobacterium NaphS2]
MNHLSDYLESPIRSGIFTGISEEMRPKIFSAGQRRFVKAGTTLFHEADAARQCYFVQKGRLKLTKQHIEGKEAIVRYINPGEMTAAVAVFKENTYPVTASAVEDTTVVGWDRPTILKILSDYPSLTINLLSGALDRLEEMQKRYLELCAERVEQRIARALLRIMRRSGRKTHEGVVIDFRLSRQDLADYTGATLYTVSRILSAWEKKGWISSGREKIMVNDPHALVAFADNG